MARLNKHLIQILELKNVKSIEAHSNKVPANRLSFSNIQLLISILKDWLSHQN